jgi:Putative peptidoglycan binding domain
MSRPRHVLTPAELLASVPHRVMRATRESNFINTINVVDRLTIDFVWYPGAADFAVSLVDVFVWPPDAAGQHRVVRYTWSRRGQPDVTRTMLSGRVTLPLPPAASGTLTVFNTSWEITRVGAGVTMSASNTLRGVQERLNRLGYHLRRAGARSAGVDGIAGAGTQRAVLAFQVDYRKPAAVAAGPARLQIRGEWDNTPSIQANLDSYNGTAAGVTPNPSATDGPQLQAGLVNIVGA